MKKTLKNALTGLSLAVVLASAGFTGCQMNVFKETDDEFAETVDNRIEARKLKGDEDLTESEKIDKIYEKVTEKKDYEYKGEKIAIARITEKLTEKIPVDQIEDPVVKYFAECGIRMLDKGTQALDSMLNDCTFGLYDVAVGVFWPEESGIGAETQMILDKVDEVSKQIADLDTNMQKNFDDQKFQALVNNDTALLSKRKELLVKLRESFTNNKEITSFLKGTDSNNMSFSSYQQFLSAITGRSYFEGSLPDILSTTKTFFSLYDQSIGNSKKTYSDICAEYAKAVSGWGYEYDNLIKTIANEELIETMKIMTILKTAYCPYIDEKVNYNYNIMKLLSFLGQTESSYKNDVNNLLQGCVPVSEYEDTCFDYQGVRVTPEMIRDAKGDTEKLYEYLLAYLCNTKKYNTDGKAFFPSNYAEIVMSKGDIKEVEGMNGENEDYRLQNLLTYMESLEGGYENWLTLENAYNAYVNKVNDIYNKLVNDRLGYVTCLIPGVEETFLTSMGYVYYGDELYDMIGSSNAKDGGVNRVFHGYTGSNTNGKFVKNINVDVYERDFLKLVTKNKFKFPTKDNYKKIYEYYHDGFHKIHKSVPVAYADRHWKVIDVVKDVNAEVIEDPTLTEIFYYGAGIGFRNKQVKINNNLIQWTPSPLNEGLKEIGLYPHELYAYEEGLPTVKVESKHASIGEFFDSFWDGRWEYNVYSNGLYGNKNGNWSEEFEESDWMITGVASKKDTTSIEEIISKGSDKYAKIYSNMTYVFPSIAHDLNWKTYWENKKK